ncbi:DNA polymerase alpha catalytic subunit [Raphanus sativus]|nr:DNA polymerase alpha catalytic subunit [Raphanus sativus]
MAGDNSTEASSSRKNSLGLELPIFQGKEEPEPTDESGFDLDAADDGSLRFYILDAYEEAFGASMGTVYLFGKVKTGDTYKSCCVVVKNMQRCVYAIPNEMASGLKNEISQQLLRLDVSNYSMALVKVSWCKFEVTVESPKAITVLVPEEKVVHPPPAVVTAINLKTIVNEKHNITEIVSASVLCFHNAKKEVANRNSKNGCSVLSFENSERALLNRLFLELNKLDSDVLVGHNISRFDLDVLSKEPRQSN